MPFLITTVFGYQATVETMLAERNLERDFISALPEEVKPRRYTYSDSPLKLHHVGFDRNRIVGCIEDPFAIGVALGHLPSSDPNMQNLIMCVLQDHGIYAGLFNMIDGQPKFQWAEMPWAAAQDVQQAYMYNRVYQGSLAARLYTKYCDYVKISLDATPIDVVY